MDNSNDYLDDEDYQEDEYRYVMSPAEEQMAIERSIQITAMNYGRF